MVLFEADPENKAIAVPSAGVLSASTVCAPWIELAGALRKSHRHGECKRDV
jgi:hypothetical protein